MANLRFIGCKFANKTALLSFQMGSFMNNKVELLRG